MAILRVRKGQPAGADFPLPRTSRPSVIGRDPEVCVALDDARASRRNSRIRHVYGQWIVEDLKSSNGTFVNAKRIDKTRLQDGNTVQVGKTLLAFDEKAIALPIGREFAGVQATRAVREAAGVVVLAGFQAAMEREVRVDWLLPATSSIGGPSANGPSANGPSATGLAELLGPAIEEASRVRDLGILSIVHVESPSNDGGVVLVFKGPPLPSVEDRLSEILALPLDLRVHVFRQLVEVVLERATWESLRSPVGLAHVGIDWMPNEPPMVQVAPIELTAWVAEHSGNLQHLWEFVPYLPPEHQSKTLPDAPTFSSAMYNLGAMGYHLLTGQTPMGDGSVRAILDSHRSLKPAPATLVRSEVPPGLSDLLERMLDKDPTRRPAGRQPVLDAIVESQGTLAVVAPEVGPVASPPEESRGSPGTSGGPLVAPEPPRGAIPRSRATESGWTNPRPRPAARLRSPVRYLPAWPLIWVGLFFAARYISKLIFRVLEES